MQPIHGGMEAVIRGTTMPVLEVHLTPGESVVAESGQLGWFDEGIELETTTALAGADGMWDAAKRSFGGSTFFMTRYSSTTQPGIVAFPARLPGKIFQVPLGPGRSYLIQQGGFLAGLACGGLLRFGPKRFNQLWPLLALGLVLAIALLAHPNTFSPR